MNERTDWTEFAAGLPCTASFEAVVASQPARLAPNELVELIVAAEKLISHVQALQVAAVAEFARPGRCGDLSDLIDMLTEKGGQAKLPDGTINVEALELLVREQAQRMASAEVAAALCQSPRGASRRVCEALEMVDHLPATLSALRDGRIDRARAAVIADRTHLLADELRSGVEAAAVELAITRTPGQCKPMIDRRVIAADPDAARKRTEAARAERCVVREAGEDGMGMIKAILPAEGAVSVYELLDSIARATAGQDDRPMGARRADALIDICVSLLTDGHVEVTPLRAGHPNDNYPGHGAEPANEAPLDQGEPGTSQPENAAAAGHERHDGPAVQAFAENGEPNRTGDVSVPSPADAIVSGPREAERLSPAVLSRVMSHHGRSAHLNVTMSATTLAAFADHPGTLAGHGAVTADVARMIASSIASLTVIAVNEQGNAVAVGATTYPPRLVVRDQVIAANSTCRFPACRQPAHLCELDHRDPFDHTHPGAGGLTEPANLDPLCQNNHLMKTHTAWSATRSAADGVTLNWTSPTGHGYLDHPDEHALPEQDERVHDARLCEDGWTAGTSSSSFDGRIGIADAEHRAACAEPAEPAESISSTFADITRRFIRRRAERDRQDRTRQRIEQIVHQVRARQNRSARDGANPARPLFGKTVIGPLGRVEIGLHQLISAANDAPAAVTDVRWSATKVEQPPF